MCDTKDNIEKGRTNSKSLKGDKRYKDAPRFKTIYGYEDDFTKGFKKELVSLQKELITTMWNMGPKKRSNGRF